MEIIQFFLDLLKDPRQFIADWINNLGPIWVYLPLWIIIFVETGLVIMPFLPGDSLLFTAGIFAADGGGLNLAVLLILLIAAAVLGNTSNYWIGRKIGQAIIDSGRVKALTPKRIKETQAFFDKYGLLAIVVTRFFPIIRTFAPFLAGVGNMNFARFTLYNVIGGALWVTIFTLLGYFFGGIPFVQDNFELVIIAIVVISFLPVIIGAIRAKFGKKKEVAEEQEPEPGAGNKEEAGKPKYDISEREDVVGPHPDISKKEEGDPRHDK
jgi:membrane-associated protein